MKRKIVKLVIYGFCISLLIACDKKERVNENVNMFMGSGLNGRVAPVASVPFGMMQIGADTRAYESGYHYDDKTILGFSHLHKSGGGCNDFLDVLFMPLRLNQKADTIKKLNSQEYQSSFSHKEEKAEPGYYSVKLYEKQLSVELTASAHCGIQRYKYSKGGGFQLL
ncbi:hypothetical protein [Flavobacterium gilvum]|uniref:hypothetical protein n=1 Tax=Flavobacterium gilvum TaxID=1492737 RepID=UPI0018D36193|nr:hypothetical protein [Flavobacterium gilvum]